MSATSLRPAPRLVASRDPLRCGYCHDAFRPRMTVASCPACGLALHPECASDLGRCATLGCGGAAFHPHAWVPPLWARTLDWSLTAVSFLLVTSTVLAFSGALLLKAVQAFHDGLVPW